jgi:hypothetical protein
LNNVLVSVWRGAVAPRQIDGDKPITMLVNMFGGRKTKRVIAQECSVVCGYCRQCVARLYWFKAKKLALGTSLI